MKLPTTLSPRLIFGVVFLGLCSLVALITAVVMWPEPIDAPGEFTEQLTAITTASPTETTVEPEMSQTAQVIPPSQTPEQVSTNTPATNAPTLTPIDPWGGSPPGGRIAFTCFIGGFDQICLMNADGTGITQLTDTKATDFYASLSANGENLVFSSRRTGNFELFWILLSNNFTTQITSEIGSLFAPEISPDGGWVIFTNSTGGSQSIWKMRLDGTEAFALTSGFWDDVDPTWSPDGSRIAFASSRGGSRQLYVMDADGGNVQQVTNLADMGGRSSWSPDGDRLAFYAGPFADRDIFTIRLDGSGLVQVTNGGDNLGPSWSPDGLWIAFTSFRDGNNEIYIIHPDGSFPVNLTDRLISDWQPRWGP